MRDHRHAREPGQTRDCGGDDLEAGGDLVLGGDAARRSGPSSLLRRYPFGHGRKWNTRRGTWAGSCMSPARTSS